MDDKEEKCKESWTEKRKKSKWGFIMGESFPRAAVEVVTQSKLVRSSGCAVHEDRPHARPPDTEVPTA